MHGHVPGTTSPIVFIKGVDGVLFAVYSSRSTHVVFAGIDAYALHRRQEHVSMAAAATRSSLHAAFAVATTPASPVHDPRKRNVSAVNVSPATHASGEATKLVRHGTPAARSAARSLVFRATPSAPVFPVGADSARVSAAFMALAATTQLRSPTPSDADVQSLRPSQNVEISIHRMVRVPSNVHRFHYCKFLSVLFPPGALTDFNTLVVRYQALQATSVEGFPSLSSFKDILCTIEQLGRTHTNALLDRSIYMAFPTRVDHPAADHERRTIGRPQSGTVRLCAPLHPSTPSPPHTNLRTRPRVPPQPFASSRPPACPPTH
jgi:hypothetical protein